MTVRFNAFRCVEQLLSVGILIAVTYIRGDINYELNEILPTRKAFSSDEAYSDTEVQSLVSTVLIVTTIVAGATLVIGVIGFIAGFTLRTGLLMTVSVRNRKCCSPESRKETPLN